MIINNDESLAIAGTDASGLDPEFQHEIAKEHQEAMPHTVLVAGELAVTEYTENRTSEHGSSPVEEGEN